MNRVSRRLTPVIIFVLLLGAQGLSGQDLSQTVTPTEDDLLQALELGDIDYSQYQLLLEYALLGVSPPETYLLDLLPWIADSWSASDSPAVDSNTTTKQSRALTGLFRHNASEEVETDGRVRYRTSLRLSPSPGWEVDIRAAREYTGRERLIYRNVRYQNSHRLIRSVTVGNYSERFGLGTIFGYRGKVLHYASSYCEESLLYPDYGGANGLLLQTEIGNVQNSIALSQQRDCHHRIQTVALQSAPGVRYVPALILGVTSVNNRQTGQRLQNYKIGLYKEIREGRSLFAFESAAQEGSARSYAALFEGQFVVDRTVVTFAGWAYGDRFETLTSGGKSGPISRSTGLEEIDLVYSDRRAGQEGGYLRTIHGFSERWRLENLATYAGFDQTDYRLQWSPAIVFDGNRSWSVRGSYESTLRRRKTDQTGEPERFSRERLEFRIKSDNWRASSYIATTKPASGNRFFSARLQLSLQSVDRGKIDAWLAVDRIDTERINYWYGYLRHRSRLFEGVEIGAKLAHRFSRTANNSHYTALTLEATALF